MRVDLSGTEGNVILSIYTDGSKTENHVGASIVAVKDSTEMHIETQKLNKTCTVFQAELYGIIMAVDWNQSQRQKIPSYAINVDSKAALLAIANKHTTQPLAVENRLKTIELRNSTSITFHWVKGHAGLKGNERADYLAKVAASYNRTIAYEEIPINRGKHKLEEYYIKIWNATYVNSANASHTKLFIPTIFHRLPLSLWPNYILMQFLTNHGSFQSYLHKMKKKNALANLQLSGKGCTNGPPPNDRMLPILKGTTSSTSSPSHTYDYKTSHKYRRRHEFPQKHSPLI